MRFSVIIPAYNSEKFLEECLRSVLSQSYQDFEVLIVDDGSTDSTPLLVDASVNSMFKVRGFHTVNQGPLRARRIGMENALGDYLLFLDSDDCLRHDALEVISNAIDESDADVISFGITRDAAYSAQGCFGYALPVGTYSGDRFCEVRKTVCLGRFNTLCGKAIKSGCVGDDESIDSMGKMLHGEDLYELLSIVDRASSLCQIDKALYFYRASNESGTASFKISQLDDIVRVNRKLRAVASGWGAECVLSSVIGEIEQYYYLLKINQLSCDSKKLMRSNCKIIADAMRSEGVYDRMDLVKLRIDIRLIMSAMEKGRFYFIQLVLGATELIKRMRSI